ncbi:cellulose biosynthesis cyclic di-GMP-binding regulatory protein BcsB [Rhodoblastus acidophilus]|uniref:Cyclic di-GMP-binding protein n=1 Tax=Candidatus Rhodoblastus alkanivorans TaxID=2954117 RepID=A0ABS9Z654_9HYPH|nr:cellulose biosynthesis cyclic di-GMP-binding regulatory protein BcsB [Candidatus Rhodoblastus alkanivorans]MCI4678432.1 cellulose biosynthesis cyclic di-GMP-binding regulatory protein BcsB [Candidatus Rhodoblastus alkanivorans]MCI4682895.1 cellulose biosynthesis cyclic di-GMP-binding regulatory protein BcsB [Candidatus Rhodoblastus alkanivorans]MDI4640204.1 cellulose biosynthesis cyclic di-GMP-binding regulatory protein BcsB [Rhodoblastus acidophilus]
MSPRPKAETRSPQHALRGAATTAAVILALAAARAQPRTATPDEALFLAPNRIAFAPPAFLADRDGPAAKIDPAPVGTIEAAPRIRLPAASTPVAAASPPAPLPPSAAAAPGPGPAPAPTSEPNAAEGGFVLRHLPNNIQGFRLSGEIGASEWPIYLSEAQARSRLRFQLGYMSAVSVMPEASKIIVSINDVEIGATRISAFDKVQTVDFDIPPNLVKPGFNAVRIAVDERHRVDCSLEATYELWTQIDPSQTGILAPSSQNEALGLADLAALPPDSQGALPVRAVLPGRTSPGNIERVIRAVQIIASSGHFEQPMVDVGPMAGGAYGVNLVVGLAADLARIPDLAAFGGIDGPRLAFLPATAARRATIVITGRTQDDVNRALRQFDKTAQPRGSRAGLRASQAFPGYRVTGGETVKLADLGLHSEEFSGRYFRVGFNIIMPADFYSADYAKVPLDLAGGYAPGLLSNAKIIVAINGHNAVSAPLSNARGAVFKDKTLPLPLGFLRPGLNRIEIQAQLPTAADAACDPLAAIANKKRFLFLDSTTIRIPQLARIGRVPDLAVTASGGFPYIGGGKQPKLYAPSPDIHSIAAAATFAARMAASAGRPIDFRFTTAPPAVGSGATLVVAAAGQLDFATARALGLDPERLRAAWADRSAAPADSLAKPSPADIRARSRLVLQKNLPAACHLRRAPVVGPASGVPPVDIAALLAEAANPPETPANRDLFDAWSEKLGGHERWRQWLKGAGAEIADVAGAAWRGTMDEAQALIANGDEAAAKIIYRSDNSLLIAQTVRGAAADDVWTLVTAPNSTLLSQSVDCLSDPRVWRHVDGRLSLLDDSDGAIATLPASQLHFVATQPLSVSNVRLISASWLSLNPAVYVTFTLIVAFILAAATLEFVRNVGRRAE